MNFNVERYTISGGSVNRMLVGQNPGDEYLCMTNTSHASDGYYDEMTIVDTNKIIERDVFKGVDDKYENYLRIEED